MAFWEDSQGSSSSISIHAALKIPPESTANGMPLEENTLAKTISSVNANDMVGLVHETSSCQDHRHTFGQDTPVQALDIDEPLLNPIQSIEVGWTPERAKPDFGHDPDAAFFNSLDAAFWAIVGSPRANEAASGQDPSMQIHGPDIEIEESFLDSVAPSMFRSIDALLQPTVEVGTIKHRKTPAQNDLATLETCYQGNEIAASPAPVSLIEPNQPDDLAPPGFWRRNTLY